MTGLLCISALTNEHSNKGEPKDHCVSAAGVYARVSAAWPYVQYVCLTERTALVLKKRNPTRGNEGRQNENKSKKGGRECSHDA